MANNPSGSIGIMYGETIYGELDLDASRYTREQQKLYKDATATTLNINAIAHSSEVTKNDIRELDSDR